MVEVKNCESGDPSRVNNKRFATRDSRLAIRLATVFSCLVLASCEVGPDYQKPNMSLPIGWKEFKKPDESGKEAANEAIQAEWWKHFNDPVLDGIITHALAQNFDLKIAEARIAEARAAVTSSRADLVPIVSAAGSGTREANEVAFGAETFPKPFNIFQAGFDASWELDLFGGHKRALESSSALFSAAKATRDDIKVSLLAEAARDYMNVRKLQTQVTISENLVASEESNQKIQQELFNAGSVPETNAIIARTTLLQAKSQLLNYQNILVASEYALDLLLGEKPGYVKALVADVKPIDVADKNIVLQAPAEVIANRPDVRAAERRLASSTAEIGVAKAKLFPDVSLSGFFGLFSPNSDTLLQAGSKSWNVGGNITWPILNYGKLSAGVVAEKAQHEEALATYKKSIIAALVDVESSVSSYNKQEENRALMDKTVAENKHSVDIADMRYKDGDTSLIEVISAKRTLYAAQIQSAEATAGSAQGFISVYKSLGGGWKTPKKPEQTAKK